MSEEPKLSESAIRHGMDDVRRILTIFNPNGWTGSFLFPQGSLEEDPDMYIMGKDVTLIQIAYSICVSIRSLIITAEGINKEMAVDIKTALMDSINNQDEMSRESQLRIVQLSPNNYDVLPKEEF